MKRNTFKMLTLAAAATMMVCGCGEKKESVKMENGNPAFLELAKSRFSVRYYAKRQVEQEKIDAILEAARVAPTAKNLQPFHIYALKSEDALKKINALTRCA